MESETVSLGLDDAHEPAIERRVQLYDAPSGSPGPVKAVLEYNVPGGVDAGEWRAPSALEWEYEIAHGAPVGTLREVTRERGLVFVRFSSEPGTVFFRET